MENVKKSKPEREKLKQESLRLPASWWPEIEEAAQKEQRPKNNWLMVVIGKALGKIES